MSKIEKVRKIYLSVNKHASKTKRQNIFDKKTNSLSNARIRETERGILDTLPRAQYFKKF